MYVYDVKVCGHSYAVERSYLTPLHKTQTRRWSWFAGPLRAGIFEIEWQQSESEKINRMALALVSKEVGILDISRIPELQ